MVTFNLVLLLFVVVTIGVANAETPQYYTNQYNHSCYYALTPDFMFYDICYPSLDDRLIGEKSYSSIPDLTTGTVIIDEGNTLTSNYSDDVR